MERDRLARYAAPVAFLAAVTVGVIVIRAGFEHGNHHARNPPATVTTKTTTTSHGHGHKKVQTKTYTIQSGDTFASIAVKTGTTVAELEHLNPHVDPQALHVGETIHVK